MYGIRPWEWDLLDPAEVYGLADAVDSLREVANRGQ